VTAILTVVLMVLMIVVSAALIGIILVQRGRGSGLVGLGGSGVEQAFGTHAATLAQKVTVALAVLFLALTVALGLLYQRVSSATRVTGTGAGKGAADRDESSNTSEGAE